MVVGIEREEVKVSAGAARRPRQSSLNIMVSGELSESRRGGAGCVTLSATHDDLLQVRSLLGRGEANAREFERKGFQHTVTRLSAAAV